MGSIRVLCPARTNTYDYTTDNWLSAGTEYKRLVFTADSNCIICVLLFKQPVCIKDITPNLQSCELLQEMKGSFKCKADVFLSLDSSDCAADWAVKEKTELDDEAFF